MKERSLYEIILYGRSVVWIVADSLVQAVYAAERKGKVQESRFVRSVYITEEQE